MNKPVFGGLVLIALLFLVWQIAHTTSLRELLLWSGLILFCWLAWKGRPYTSVGLLQLPFWSYAGLTLWLLIVALLVSPETNWSLGEFRGQWLKGVAALVLGGCAGLAVTRTERAQSWVPSLLIVPLAVYVVFTDCIVVSGVLQDGAIPSRFKVLGSGPDKANFVTNLFLAFVLAEIFVRVAQSGRGLRVSNQVLGAMLALGLLAEYANRMRNGTAELVALLLLLAFLFLKDRAGRISRRMIVSAVGALVLIVGITGVISYRSDPRWQTFSETVVVAWDIDKHEQWRDPEKGGYPTLSDGQMVEGSAYLRVSALHVGFRLLSQNPLGVGYGRNAYGHALRRETGDTGLGHSHSGLLDLAIGAGIPGTVLWITFLGSLFVVGWRRFRETREYPPLLLMLVVTGYSARMLVDSIIRDHMLQQFLLLAGLLAVLAVARRPEAT